MKKIVYPANNRGLQDHGWLKAAHSFSFANYYDPSRMHFGLLRVLNDDIVAPGMGFGMHPHDNMEIVTIPLKGSLAHRDSLGSEGNITYGEVQVMSAGSGIRHSEFNGSAVEEVNLLQIWVFPKERNIEPRYDQKRFDLENNRNRFVTLVSPDQTDGSMWINQNAVFSIGTFDGGIDTDYKPQFTGNGVYVFVIDGSVRIDDTVLKKRDALGVYDVTEFKITMEEQAKILLIEVPME